MLILNLTRGHSLGNSVVLGVHGFLILPHFQISCFAHAQIQAVLTHLQHYLTSFLEFLISKSNVKRERSQCVKIIILNPQTLSDAF